MKMDLAYIFWCLTVTLVSIAQAASVPPTHSSHRQDRDEKSKGDNQDKSNQTTTESPELPSLLRARSRADEARGRQPSSRDQGRPNCCENGGLCVMGVFCHCGDKYYGFRCEFERASCGPVQHDQWVRLGCNLCRCFDARLHCLVNVYSGCAGRPVNEDIQVDDYTDDMEIFPKDTDPSNVDINGYNTDDYLYYYDSGDTFDYSDDINSERNNRRGGASRGRGKPKGKGDHSSASRLYCCHCLPLLGVCLLMSTLVSFLSIGRRETFFVS